jgi:excisionase family DNA binding protein
MPSTAPGFAAHESYRNSTHCGDLLPWCAVSDPIHWMGTREACERLGVTLRTLYRFIDEGQLPAYKMGRVIRLQAQDIDIFIEHMRIAPGSLEHLYPEPKSATEPRPTSESTV